MPSPLRGHSPLLFVAVSAGLVLGGCSSSSIKTDGTGASQKPEIILTVASLNLTNLNKRVERADIAGLWQVLKKEKVEILAVQNLSRYPGVASRVDIVTELSSQADWRNAWGEMTDNSGRLIGNAVFSAYPVRSSSHAGFTGTRPATWEGALHAVIDGGVREILVVSAYLPPKGTAAEQKRCLEQIMDAQGDRRLPVIVMGNLPAAATPLQDVNASLSAPTRIQWDGAGVLKATSTTKTETPLGTVVIATFELYRSPV